MFNQSSDFIRGEGFKKCVQLFFLFIVIEHIKILNKKRHKEFLSMPKFYKSVGKCFETIPKYFVPPISYISLTELTLLTLIK